MMIYVDRILTIDTEEETSVRMRNFVAFLYLHIVETCKFIATCGGYVAVVNRH